MAEFMLPLDSETRRPQKRCKWCREIKPVTEFHYRIDQGRHRAECKDCYRAAMNARRDPIDNRARVKAWGKANPEKRAVQSRRMRDRRRTDLRRWIGQNLATTKLYCRRRELEYSLTADAVVDLYERQGRCCALTGRELLFGSRGAQRDSLSIDRLDQSGGYTLDNIRLVTFQANFARNRYSDDELYEFCEAVLATRARGPICQPEPDLST